MVQITQMNADTVTDTTEDESGISSGSSNIITTVPLYFLGYEALMTEMNVLRSRKSDDPFISGLRDLEEQHRLLRSIKLDQEKMSAVYIDQAAYTPGNPIKRDSSWSVSLATVVGFFSGIFLALFIEFVQNQRKNHSE